MFDRQLPRTLRAFSLCALASCALVAGAGRAVASDSPAHVDQTRPHPQPAYPDSARATGEQGTVLVDLYVRPNGHIGKFRVSQSSGFADLDDAAVEGVLNWRFVPAMRSGDTVSDWTSVKIEFQLPQTASASAPSN